MKSPTPTSPPVSADPTGSGSASRGPALNPVGIKNIRVEIVVPAAILERVSSPPVILAGTNRFPDPIVA